MRGGGHKQEENTEVSLKYEIQRRESMLVYKTVVYNIEKDREHVFI